MWVVERRCRSFGRRAQILILNWGRRKCLTTEYEKTLIIFANLRPEETDFPAEGDIVVVTTCGHDRYQIVEGDNGLRVNLTSKQSESGSDLEWVVNTDRLLLTSNAFSLKTNYDSMKDLLWNRFT